MAAQWLFPMNTTRTLIKPHPPFLNLSLLLFVAVICGASKSRVEAAIAQRGAATTGTTAGTSLTITKPAGVVAGDVMIVNIAQAGNSSTAPSLNGWTLISGADLGGSTARYGAVLYRVPDASEGSSYTFKLGVGVSSAVGGMVAFSGVDTSGATPFDSPPGAIRPGSTSTSVSATNVATLSPNAAVIMFGMVASAAPTWSRLAHHVAWRACRAIR